MSSGFLWRGLPDCRLFRAWSADHGNWHPAVPVFHITDAKRPFLKSPLSINTGGIDGVHGRFEMCGLRDGFPLSEWIGQASKTCSKAGTRQAGSRSVRMRPPPLGMSEQNLKNLFLELCKEEQRLTREMMCGMVLPDRDAPVQVRLDAIGEEIDKVRKQVSEEDIQRWMEELHG